MPRVYIGLAGGISGSGTVANVPLLPRIIPARQDFAKGAGYTFTYQLSANQNGFLSKAWGANKVQTILPVEVTFPNGRPVYDNLFPRTAAHRVTATISPTGLVTLSALPYSGYTGAIRVHYMYKLDMDETCANYVHEDIINYSEMEINGNVLGPQVSTQHAIARYYDNSGKVIDNSQATVDDNGSIHIPAGEDYYIGTVPISIYFPIRDYTVDSGASVGDVVYPSTTVSGKVVVNTDNRVVPASVGVIIAVSGTDCTVQHYGVPNIVYSGLALGKKVFLSTGGGLTTTPPTTGYVQQIGYCVETGKVFLNPLYTRAKRNPF